jgi:RhoGAP domain
MASYNPGECGLTNVDSQNPALDFRNPENFYHDVNSVTGLLKQFCRDLPDPLLTWEHHDSFVTAASTFTPAPFFSSLLLFCFFVA